MFPYMFASLLNTTKAISGDFDRSFIAPDVLPTASVNNNKWMLANPENSCGLDEQTMLPAPAHGDICTNYPLGSVAINIQNWFLDSPEWLLFCDQSSPPTWTRITGGSKKNNWEQFNPDKRWVRVNVDTSNKNNPGPDNPTSWLDGNATGLVELHKNCDNPEFSGWRSGGSLYICMRSMTNEQTFVAVICTRGVELDTPNCNGMVLVYDESGLIEPTDAMMEQNCPQQQG